MSRIILPKMRAFLTCPWSRLASSLLTQPDRLISRFSISTASAVPIRLLSATLDSQGSLAVLPTPAPPLHWYLPPLFVQTLFGSRLTLDQLVFPKQPASLIWKIIHAADRQARPMSELGGPHRLALTIVYRRLDQGMRITGGVVARCPLPAYPIMSTPLEIYHAAESALVDALEASPYRDLRRLLTPALVSRLRSRSSPLELEKIGLLGELALGPFDDMRWDEPLQAIAPDHAIAVREWLRSWHEVGHPPSLPTGLVLFGLR